MCASYIHKLIYEKLYINHMKNYINFITEKYTEELSEDEFDKLFKTSPLYDTFMKNDINDLTIIYRGVEGNDYRGKFNNYYGDYNVIDPKEIERVSPNASSNLYNLFFSNSERWSEYPKRNKSLICGDFNAVSRRGDNTQMIVIPLEHVKIGVCSDDDIWTSFGNSLKNCSYINNFFNFIDNEYNRIGGFVDPIDDQNWNNFVKDLNLYDELRKGEENLYKYIRDNSLIEKYIDEKISTLELLDELFDPKKNDFQLLEYDGTNLPTNREVWTDSKCLLVKSNMFFKYLIKNKSK